MGGVAAAIGPGDSPQDHLDDTLTAGAGLCDEDAVRTLVTEAWRMVVPRSVAAAHLESRHDR